MPTAAAATTTSQSSNVDTASSNGSEKTKNPASLPEIGSVTPNDCPCRQSRYACQCRAPDDAKNVAATTDAAPIPSATVRVRATPARAAASTRLTAMKPATEPAV